MKHFRDEAPYQEAVLCALEAQFWTHFVIVTFPHDPGVSFKERLHHTIENLNRNVRPHLRFGQEGSGDRACWETNREAYQGHFDGTTTVPQRYP